MEKKKKKEYAYPKIKLAMLENGDTMRGLAKILGISYFTLTNKIYGRTDWTIGEIEKLCIYYGLDYYDLFK